MPRKAPAPPVWRNRVIRMENVPLAHLAAHDRNWRQHPPQQQDVLLGVIHELGYVAPVIVSEATGRILDGHLRVELARREGQPTIPVTYVQVTEAEELLVLSTIDPLVGLAAADRGQLATLLTQVQSGEAAVQAFLAQLAEAQGVVPVAAGGVAEVEPDLDHVEELREEYGVELHQIWSPGEHRLICGDCTDKRVVERLMDGSQAQMIFTDPPYGVDYDGGMKKRKRLDNDTVGTAIYANALPVLASAVDEHAPLYLWYADAHAAAAAAAAAAAGYVIVAQIIWAKNHAQFMSSAHYHGKHEPCFYGHKRGKTARWHGPTNEVTLWECDRAPSNDYHPTQKPVPLALRALTNSTIAGDSVLDGFLGGGTTLMACESLGRRCFACELDPGYVAVCLDRWARATSRTPVRLA